MEDYNKVLDATEVAENANGVAAEKMTVYNESLAAAQNRLTASIQQFAQDSNLDQILALAYDGLSKVVEILNILLNKIPILSPMIKALGVALAAAFSAKMLGNAVTLVNTITGIASAASGALSILGTTAFTIGSFAVPIWGVVAAVTAIGVALKGVYDIVQDNTPEAKLEKANQKLDESKKNIEDTKTQISDVSKKIEEIEDKDTLTLADEQEKQRLEEQRDVLEQILKYQTEINAENEKEVKKQFGEQMGAKYTSGAIDSDAAYERATRKTSIGSSYAAAAGDTAKLYNAENASIAELTANLRILSEERENLSEKEGDHSKELEENNQKTQENINVLKSRATAIGEDISRMQELGLTNTTYYKNALAQFNELQAYIDPSNWETIAIKDLIDTSGLENKIKEAIQSGDEAGQEMAEAYARNFADKISEDKSMKQAMAKSMGIDVNSLNIDDITGEILSKFHQMYDNVSDGYDEVVQNVFGKVDIVDAYANILEKVNDKTSVLSKAYKELTKQGSLSTDTTKKLIEIYPDLATQLDFTSGKITLNVEVLKDLYNAEYDSAEATVKAEIEKTEATIAGVEARIAALDAEKTKLLEVLNAGAESGRDEGFYERQMRLLEQTGSNANASLAEAEEHLESLKKLLGLVQNTARTGLGTGTKDTGTSGSTGDKTTKSDIINQFKDITNKYTLESYGAWSSQEAINAATTAYSDLLDEVTKSDKIEETAKALGISIADMSTQDAIDYVKKTIEEQAGTVADAYEKLIKADLEAKNKELKAQQEVEKAQKEQYDKALEYIKDLEDATVEMIETGIDLLEKAGDIVFDLLGKISDRYDKQADNIDKISDELDKQKDAFEDKIDSQKEMLKLQKEEMDNADELADKNKAIADIDAQLMELQYDNSAEAQAKRLKLLDERAKKEKELTDYQTEYDYDSKIDALDREKSQYEKTIEAQKKALEEQKKTIESSQKSFEGTLSNIQNAFNTFTKFLDSDVVKNFLSKALISYGGDDFKNLMYGWNKIFGTGNDADITNLWSNFAEAGKVGGYQTGQWVGDYQDWLTAASNAQQTILDNLSNAMTNISIEKDKLEAGMIDLSKTFTSVVDVKSIKSNIETVRKGFGSFQTYLTSIASKSTESIGQSSISTLLTIGKTAQNTLTGVANSGNGIISTIAQVILKMSDKIGGLLGTIAKSLGIENLLMGGVPAMTTANTAGMTGTSKLVADSAIATGAAGTTGVTGVGGLALGSAAIPEVLGTLGIAGVGLGWLGTMLYHDKKVDEIKADENWKSDKKKFWSVVGRRLAAAGPLTSIGLWLWDKSQEKHHSGADYVKKHNPALDKMLGLGSDETVSILKVGEAVVPTWANNATSSANSNSYTGIPFRSPVNDAIKSAKAVGRDSYTTGDSTISISMPINIQGDADASTVKALKEEANNIVNKVLRTINNQTKIGGYRNIKAATV